MKECDFGPGSFGGYGMGPGDGMGRGFGRHNGWRGRMMQARRGDMKYIILNVLSDEPMHGYDIMRKLEEKSEGLWKPSPGSVYPTLQYLEDEDLVSVETDKGKKVYTITKKGREEVEKYPLKNPWEHWDKDDLKKAVRLRHVFKEMWPSLASINHGGDEKKIDQAFDIVQKAADDLDELAKSV